MIRCPSSVIAACIPPGVACRISSVKPKAQASQPSAAGTFPADLGNESSAGSPGRHRSSRLYGLARLRSFIGINRSKFAVHQRDLVFKFLLLFYECLPLGVEAIPLTLYKRLECLLCHLYPPPSRRGYVGVLSTAA